MLTANSKLKYLFLVFLFSSLIHAQQSKIDSLRTVLLKETNDTSYVKKLIQIANLQTKNQPDSALLSYNQSLNVIASKLKAPSPIKNKLFYYKGLVNHRIGNLYYRYFGIKESIPYFRKAFTILDSLKNEKKLGSLNALGASFLGIGQVDSAIHIFNQCEKILITENNRNGLAETYNNLAISYIHQGIVDKCLYYHQKSLKIREEFGDVKGMAQSYNNIAIIYHQQNLKEDAKLYFEKCLTTARKAGDKSLEALAYNNLAIIASGKNEFEEALKLNKQSLAIRLDLKEMAGIAMSYYNFGNVYMGTQQIEKAKENFLKSLEISEKLGDIEYIFNNFNALTQLYKGINNIPLFEKYAKAAFEAALKLQSPTHLKDSYQELNELYVRKGDYKKAHEMYKNFITMRDSISNDETKQLTMKKKHQIEMEARERELKLIASNEKKLFLQKQENERARNKIIFVSFSIILLAVLVFTFFIYRGLQEKRKANLIILKQKALVEQKQKEVTESIVYATRIQRSLMASEKYIEKMLGKLKSSK